MGCHCSEISKIKHDLSVLSSQISKLDSSLSKSREIDDMMHKAADKLEENIDIKAKNEIISALKNITKGQTDKLEDSLQDFKRYKSNLEDKLDSLKRSDHDYHERKKHND